MITAEYLKQRLDEAEAERARLVITLRQLDGAVGTLKALLVEAQKPEKDTANAEAQSQG